MTIMTNWESQDLPPYDAIQFEMQRHERALEFAKAVRSLARFNLNQDSYMPEGWTDRGAEYVLPEGMTVDVARQGWFKKPESSTSAVQLLTPWTEHDGIDGEHRRVRVGRHIHLHVSPPADWDALVELEKELPEPPESLKELTEAWLKNRERVNLENSLDPNYRPPELLHARSFAVVEVKMRRGPNWRTERADTVTGKDAKLSHLAARRQAGESVEVREYSIAEHQDLMRLLESIKTMRIKARRPTQDIA